MLPLGQRFATFVASAQTSAFWSVQHSWEAEHDWPFAWHAVAALQACDVASHTSPWSAQQVSGPVVQG